MISTKNVVSALLVVSALSSVQAQSSKVAALEKKGNQAYAAIRYSDALNYFKKAHQLATAEEAAANLAAKVADCYWLVRNYDSAHKWYGSLPAARLSANGAEKQRLAELKAITGSYADASAMLSGMNGYADRAAGFSQTKKMVRDSANWNVQYLQGINTDVFREFSPVQADGGLVWTTNQPKKNSRNGIMGWDNMGYNRLMKVGDLSNLAPQAVPARNVVDLASLDAKRPKRLARQYELSDVDLLGNISIPATLAAKLKQIQAISSPVESAEKLKFNVAHASYNADSKTLFMSANQQGKLKNKVRTVGVSSATLNGAVFANLAFLLEQSADFSSMHPAVHANGSLVVFSSNRAGGAGGFDLYMTQKDADGKWSEPKALAGVNTVGNEVFPSFGADGKLYFSTDGRAGLGGLDIYAAAFENGSVKNISQLSYPVNSSFDDFGMSITADGKTGYFSSDRLGSDDVFKFDYAKKTLQVTGQVKSQHTNSGKANVEVVLTEKDENGQVVGTLKVKTDASGKFTFQGLPNRSYEITANDGTNPAVSSTFTTDGAKGNKDAGILTINDVPVDPPFETQQFIVYFNFNKSNVREEYDALLKKAAELMASNPKVSCELSGHTDQYGSEEYNMTLSAMRAEAVKKYLEGFGANVTNIETKSFGESQLVELIRNKKKAEINRRVVIVLQKK